MAVEAGPAPCEPIPVQTLQGFRARGADSAALRQGSAHAPRAVEHQPRFYRPELDLLRLAAFLMVWTAHALIPFRGLLPPRLLAAFEGAGSCGVPIFFFLSAYLITELLRRERDLTGSIHLGHFYLRRILRIWPLYFAMLAVYALLGFRFHGFRIEPGRLLASCLLAGNWYIALHPAITTPLRALWSISVEEQWYLLSPLVLLWLLRRKPQLLVACVLAVAASDLLLVLLAHRAAQAELHVTAWVNSGVQFQYLALGVAAAVLLDGRIPRLATAARGLLLCAGAGCVLAASAGCHIRQANVPHTALSLVCGYLLAGAGAVCLFFSLFGVRPQRCPPVLVQLGQLSFGLYVLHETAFFLADAAARRFGLPHGVLPLAGEKLFALVLTALLAWMSYHLWERPFLRLKSRWTHVRTREAT